MTRGNTTQHEYNTRQHETTRAQREAIRHNRSTTRYNTTQQEKTRVKLDATRDNTRSPRRNTSTKEARVAKLEVYFALFVIELYILLISFRNNWYSPTCNIVSIIWTPRDLGPSEIRKEPSNRNPKGIIKCEFRKVNSFQMKVTRKNRKSVYNIKMYFRKFFTLLERTSTFTTSIFRAIYKSSSPDDYTKKAFCCRYVAYLQTYTHAEVWSQ